MEVMFYRTGFNLRYKPTYNDDVTVRRKLKTSTKKPTQTRVSSGDAVEAEQHCVIVAQQ